MTRYVIQKTDDLSIIYIEYLISFSSSENTFATWGLYLADAVQYASKQEAIKNALLIAKTCTSAKLKILTITKEDLEDLGQETGITINEQFRLITI